MRTYRKEQLRIYKVANVAAMLSKKLLGIMLLISTTSEDNWRKKDYEEKQLKEYDITDMTKKIKMTTVKQ